jgi:hypothetical protein
MARTSCDDCLGFHAVTLRQALVGHADRYCHDRTVVWRQYCFEHRRTDRIPTAAHVERKLRCELQHAHRADALPLRPDQAKAGSFPGTRSHSKKVSNLGRQSGRSCGSLGKSPEVMVPILHAFFGPVWWDTGGCRQGTGEPNFRGNTSAGNQGSTSDQSSAVVCTRT